MYTGDTLIIYQVLALPGRLCFGLVPSAIGTRNRCFLAVLPAFPAAKRLRIGRCLEFGRKVVLDAIASHFPEGSTRYSPGSRSDIAPRLIIQQPVRVHCLQV